MNRVNIACAGGPTLHIEMDDDELNAFKRTKAAGISPLGLVGVPGRPVEYRFMQDEKTPADRYAMEVGAIQRKLYINPGAIITVTVQEGITDGAA